MIKSEKLDKCPGCGGVLKFCPSTQNLKCPNCQSEYDIEAEMCCPKHCLDEHNQTNQDWIAQNKKINCENCGAAVVLNNLEFASNCPYCLSSMVVESALNNQIKPDAIIPFQFDRVEAAKRFSQGIRKKAFIPNRLKKEIPQTEIQGIYISTFLFDAQSYSSYSGCLERDETVTVNGKREVKTSSFFISGTEKMFHKNVVIEASTKINQAQLDGIKPFDYSKFREFNEGFLRGYFVESYDTKVDDCFNQAKEIIDRSIRSEILSGYFYDRVSYLDVSTELSEKKYSYGILPTYRFNYKYKNKIYTTFMNGQTGKLGGGVPRSAAKISLLVISIILLFAGVAVLAMLL